jgi:hypothetical protein
VAASKLTDAQRAEVPRLIADGVGVRTLARLWSVSPTVISRAARKPELTRHEREEREGETGVERPGYSPGAEHTEVAPPSGYPARPRVHVEGAFPDLPPGDAIEEDEPLVLVIPEDERPPERAPGQSAKSFEHPLAWAEHRLKTTRASIQHLRTAPSGYAGTPDEVSAKLAQAEAREVELRTFIDRWAAVYAGIPFGRRHTWVKTDSWETSDRAPRNLWSNPYDHGPAGRGYTVVGS